jgi:hypothetical protein
MILGLQDEDADNFLDNILCILSVPVMRPRTGKLTSIPKTQRLAEQLDTAFPLLFGF